MQGQVSSLKESAYVERTQKPRSVCSLFCSFQVKIDLSTPATYCNFILSTFKDLNMNSDQFAKYLEHLDHPEQLPLGHDVPSLYRLYQEHLTRFPYQNVELFLNQPIRDLSVEGLLESVPKSGGYCFHQSELMLFALQHLGFHVERVAAWVLMGNQFQEGMPLNHNILVVKVSDDEMFLCDPGLASASPR